MAKHFGYTGSILKDSNRLIASSQADWSGLQEGSYVIFDNGDDFYKVVNKEKFFYIKDFSVDRPDQITIEGNVGIKLSLNDNVTLTFKEYEAKSVKIINGGSGHSKGDEIEVSGGTCKTNSQDGLAETTKLSVLKTDESGKILEASVLTPGSYYDPPSRLAERSGSLSLEISYDLKEKRAMEQRAISNISFNDSKTFLTLNNALPPNVTGGKLSTEKWELILNINYVSETQLNSSYRVLVDFSPHLSIPLMRDDLHKNVSVFNEAVNMLDKEIKKIWDKLGE